MRLSDLVAMSESLLDCLLEDYELYSHDRYDHGIGERHMFRDRDKFASREDRIHRLATLLDYLGARHSADVFRFGRALTPSGSRLLLTGNRRYSE